MRKRGFNLRCACFVTFLLSVLTELSFSLLCVAAKKDNKYYYLLMVWDGVMALWWMLVFFTDDTSNFDLSEDIISSIMLPVATCFVGSLFKLPILYFNFKSLDEAIAKVLGNGNWAQTLMGLFVLLLLTGPWLLLTVGGEKTYARSSLLCRKFQLEGCIYLVDGILLYLSGIPYVDSKPDLAKGVLALALIEFQVALVCVAAGMYLYGYYVDNKSGIYAGGGTSYTSGEGEVDLVMDSDLGRMSYIFMSTRALYTDFPILIIRLYMQGMGLNGLAGFLLFKNFAYVLRDMTRALNYNSSRRRGSVLLSQSQSYPTSTVLH